MHDNVGVHQLIKDFVTEPVCGETAWPGPWFNIKMSSYQYRKSHCGDKMILWPSYLHNGISYTGKTASLYWIGAQDLAILDTPKPISFWFIYIETHSQDNKQWGNRNRNTPITCKSWVSVFIYIVKVYCVQWHIELFKWWIVCEKSNISKIVSTTARN